MRLLKHQRIAARTSRAAITRPVGRDSPDRQTQAPCRLIHKRISAARSAMEHRMHQPWRGAHQQGERYSFDRPIEMTTACCHNNQRLGLNQT
jgi:hypothetical protein